MSSSRYRPVLPKELLAEILSRLPVKDLMRFRCVSKSWNSFIFDPTLVKLHLERSSKNTHLLLTFENDNGESKECVAPCSIPCLLENPSSTVDACHLFSLDYIVLGVCNGLVCLQDYRCRDDFEEYWFRFWNPATRVMSQDSPRIRNYKIGWVLFTFGYGYVASIDTYKVVVVILDIKTQEMEVRVHCLGDTCWRSVLTCPALAILYQNGACVSYTVNWLALKRLVRLDGSGYQWNNVTTINELVIFSYDLKKETYSCLSMPGGLLEVPLHPPLLKVLKDCLCLSHHGRTSFGFWLMREFGVQNSWTHLLNISYDQLQNRNSLLDGFRFIPLILCTSEDDNMMLLANYGCVEFVLYNRRDNTHNRIDGHEDFRGGKLLFWSYDYVQSLVLPYRN